MNFRTLAVWALGVPVTIIFFFLILFSFSIDRRGRVIHHLCVFWSRILTGLAGARVRVEGIGNIPKDRPVIFISNHQGAFDIPVLQGLIPVQFRWVAKKSLFKVPFIGWSMSLAGYIGVEREHAAAAYRSIEEAALRIKKGTSVVIFPEGTRSETGELLPFKRGAFILAVKSGVPVVPVSVRGTRDILRRGGFLIRPGSVVVKIGKPIPTEGADEKALRIKTKDVIKKFFNENGGALDGKRDRD